MKLTFSVGAPMEKLCPGNIERDEFPVKRYHRISGEPYEEKEYKHFASLANGQRFEIKANILSSGWNTPKIEEYFKKLGFDCIGSNLFFGVVGIKLNEQTGNNLETISSEVPDTNGLNVMINNVRNMFKEAGFADEVLNSVKLQVTAD